LAAEGLLSAHGNPLLTSMAGLNGIHVWEGGIKVQFQDNDGVLECASMQCLFKDVAKSGDFQLPDAMNTTDQNGTAGSNVLPALWLWWHLLFTLTLIVTALFH
jgi:hypothetical protein